MEARIPEYVEKIRSLDLTLAGKCLLSCFPADIIAYADEYIGTYNGDISKPFEYFAKTCRQECIRRGLTYEGANLPDLYVAYNIPPNAPYLVSTRVTKWTPAPKKKENTSFSGDIKKQIEATKAREKMSCDRSGLDEFIRMHEAGEIVWSTPLAKNFADILVGTAKENKIAVQEGKEEFKNPLFAAFSPFIAMSQPSISPVEGEGHGTKPVAIVVSPQYVDPEYFYDTAYAQENQYGIYPSL